MKPLVLGLDLLFLFLAFGLRTFAQWRRTGDAGWRLGRPRSSAEAAARALLFSSAALLLASALATSPTHSPLTPIGVALALLGISVTVVAQWNMGRSWRIGVDPGERTELVRTGLYRQVRNPIYSGMALFAAGQL